MCAKATVPVGLNLSAARSKDGTVRRRREERTSQTSRPMMISLPLGWKHAPATSEKRSKQRTGTSSGRRKSHKVSSHKSKPSLGEKETSSFFFVRLAGPSILEARRRAETWVSMSMMSTPSTEPMTNCEPTELSAHPKASSSSYKMTGASSGLGNDQIEHDASDVTAKMGCGAPAPVGAILRTAPASAPPETSNTSELLVSYMRISPLFVPMTI